MQGKPANSVSASDRRAFGRRTTVWHAWIISGSQELPCHVLNVSPGGALLEIAPPDWLPHSFDLRIEDCSLVLPCELRHRGRHGVGVSFVDPEKGRALFVLANPEAANSGPTTANSAGCLPRPKLTPELLRGALGKTP